MFILSCNQKIDIKRQLISIGEVEMTMVWIPNGSFNMGSDDSMALDNEKPVHKITLDGFWMSETPVTNVQFAVFINESDLSERSIASVTAIPLLSSADRL